MVLLSGMNKRKPIKIELYCHTAPRSGCAESSADEIMEAYEGPDTPWCSSPPLRSGTGRLLFFNPFYRHDRSPPSFAYCRMGIRVYDAA
jgi:hypothetical protein